jgi:hypothetical protein
MNLITCPGCAIVYDADLLPFPDNIMGEDGSIDLDLAEWTGYTYFAKISCRICGTAIIQPCP